MSVSSAATSPASITVRDVIRRALQIFSALVLYAVVLFIASGTLNWPAAWWFLGINLVMVLLGGALLLKRNPAVVEARSHVRSDIETWDKWISLLITITLLATLAVPGLDRRFAWTSGFPVWLQVLGFLLLPVGYAIIIWAMLNNPFFEGGVRLQADRGQAVATTGPYRLVRHPGYVGMILQYFGAPIALGSYWGLIAGLATAAVFVTRTALEDRTLQRKLPGYADFARQTRFRLLPGIW